GPDRAERESWGISPWRGTAREVFPGQCALRYDSCRQPLRPYCRSDMVLRQGLVAASAGRLLQEQEQSSAFRVRPDGCVNQSALGLLARICKCLFVERESW